MRRNEKVLREKEAASSDKPRLVGNRANERHKPSIPKAPTSHEKPLRFGRINTSPLKIISIISIISEPGPRRGFKQVRLRDFTVTGAAGGGFV